jgi:hypothetical protein
MRENVIEIVCIMSDQKNVYTLGSVIGELKIIDLRVLQMKQSFISFDVIYQSTDQERPIKYKRRVDWHSQEFAVISGDII